MMRLLSRSGLRALLLLGIALVVVAAVALTRQIGGVSTPGRYDARTGPTSSANPDAGDDGPAETSQSTPSDDAPALAAAVEFCRAWLRRDLSPEEWHAGLEPLSTAALARSLRGADPLGVPATRAVGEPSLVLRAEGYVRVAVPVDTGTLLLSLLMHGGGWLVDGVDWERT